MDNANQIETLLLLLITAIVKRMRTSIDICRPQHAIRLSFSGGRYHFRYKMAHAKCNHSVRSTSLVTIKKI